MRPLAGALPGEVDGFEQIVTRLDSERNVGLLPWGLEIPLRPFFGVMGVAPPRAWGSISSIQPRAHGGNLDNKELVPGSTLYLPVFNEGAGFSVGDGLFITTPAPTPHNAAPRPQPQRSVAPIVS